MKIAKAGVKVIEPSFNVLKLSRIWYSHISLFEKIGIKRFEKKNEENNLLIEIWRNNIDLKD